MTFGILGNTAKPETAKVSATLVTYLRRKNLPFVIHDRLAAWMDECGVPTRFRRREIVTQAKLASTCTVAIALGGDGTILDVARTVGAKGIPILGVNLGKLGFLAELSVKELRHAINDVVGDKYSIDERMMIEATCTKDGKKFWSLNDIVIDRGASARMIEIEMYVDGEYVVTYAADGIIVATPTGSTAYSLATGGPVVAPKSKVLLLSPIAPHTLTARPMIVPENSEIRIVTPIQAKQVHITADGQVHHTYTTPAEFIVRKADYSIKLIKTKGGTFYDILRAKLLWGWDIRVENKQVR